MAQLTTFVFTDLVGSVELKQRMPGVDAAERDAAYVELVLQPHRERIEAGLAEAGGRVVSTAGDGHFLVFANTAQAARWAIAVLRAHEQRTETADAGETPAAQVRVGMHAGEPQPDPSDPDNFVGRAVDYAARLADYARGGQVLVSRTTAALIEDGGLDGVSLHEHGEHELRGIGSVRLFELLFPGHQPTPPRKTPSDPGERQWSVLPRTMGLTEYVAQSDRGSTTSVATATPPRRVGNYELGELLGAGGMGNVYKAQHAQFNRPRAVKIIRPDLVESGGDSVVNRFYQEVRATGSLEHPNLVVAIDSSSPGDAEHFLVMEYVDGLSLDKALRDGGPLPVADACEIARQAALGLEHLYEEGLVHRDVKPSNLMLTLTSSPHAPIEVTDSVSMSGRSVSAKLPVVKLMDLGLALLAPGDGEERLTRMDRGGMGTGHYMPPEQWQTTSVDIRADIYSLGCTLYHLLVGEPPFARSDLKTERAHATEPVPPLPARIGAPPALRALVERMLAKNPAERPQTPLEVAEALEPLAAGHHLADRIKRLRGGGSSTRRSDRAETHPEPADPAETNVPTSRRLLTPEPSTVPSGTSWLLTAVATVVACAAVLALALSGDRGDPEAIREKLLISAGLAAREMASAIDDRTRALETVAAEPKLTGWLTDPESSTDPLQSWLTDQRTLWDTKLGFASSSWFVTDSAGVQLARAPYSNKSIGSSYAHRDYFHGQGKDLVKGTLDVEPIREAHRSAVYDSSSAPGVLKVAVSVPVYGRRSPGAPAPVLGVLAMSLELGEFAEFEEIARATKSVEILVIDTGSNTVNEVKRSGLVLHHRELAGATRPDDPARLKSELLVEIDNALRERPSEATVLEPYADVLRRDDRRYLGAVAAVRPKSLAGDRRKPWVVLAEKPAP